MTKLIFLTSKIAIATVLLLAGTSTATSCTGDQQNAVCGIASFCGYDNECHEISCQLQLWPQNLYRK